MCGGGARQTGLRLLFSLVWEIRAASYDKGGTHPTAFLPKPRITKKQFSDLSNHPCSLSYFWEAKTLEQIQKPQYSSVGHPLLYHTSHSLLTQTVISPVPAVGPLPRSHTLGGPVKVCRGIDVASALYGIIQSERTQRELWASSLPPGRSASKSVTCSGLLGDQG